MSTHRIAYYKGKPIWSGVINKLDKVIEEVHPFKDALDADFHHSFYFSHPEKILLDNNDTERENVFFYITEDDNGKTKASTDWRVRGLQDVGYLEDYLNNSGILEFDESDYDDDDKPVVKLGNIADSIKELGQ